MLPGTKYYWPGTTTNTIIPVYYAYYYRVPLILTLLSYLVSTCRNVFLVVLWQLVRTEVDTVRAWWISSAPRSRDQHPSMGLFFGTLLPQHNQHFEEGVSILIALPERRFQVYTKGFALKTLLILTRPPRGRKSSPTRSRLSTVHRCSEPHPTSCASRVGLLLYNTSHRSC